MSNHGKRMVKENLIAQIGQGGGGTTYTAGDGIDITKDVISVDNTVALKSDLGFTIIDIDNDYQGQSSGTLTANDLAKLGPDTLIKYTNDGDTSYFRYDFASSTEIIYSPERGQVISGYWPGEFYLFGFTINATTGAYAFQGHGTIGQAIIPNSQETPSGTLTTLQLGSNTYSISGGGGSSDCPIVTWLDPAKVVTYCPTSSATQLEWDAWYKSLPVVIGRKGSTYAKNQLVNLGWPEANIFVTEHGQLLQIMGYFLMTVEANSSSNQVQQLVIVNNSSGASSIVGNNDPSAKTADKITTIMHSNNTRCVLYGVQYRGDNTYYSASTIVDPLGNTIKMVVLDPSSDRNTETSCKPSDNFIYNLYIPVGIQAPVGTSNGNPNSLIINGTTLGEGKYTVTATVDSNSVVTSLYMEEKLPINPAPDNQAGTYTLKAVVDAQGNVSYQWALDQA